MTRVAHSFFAAFIGWLAPFIALLARMQFDQSGFGYITDFEFFLFWPLIFTFIGWLLVGLPLVLIMGDNRIRQLGFVVGSATLATTLSFLVIAALYGFGLIPLIWWPLIIGLIGGTVFWLLQRYQPFRSWVFWLVPIIFFPFIRFVLLPIGISFFPYRTHVLAEGTIGPEALYAVIERVQVGDTYEELHRRYPQIFSEPVSSMSSSLGSGWSYSITFGKNGHRVTKVEIKKNNAEQGAAADVDKPRR